MNNPSFDVKVINTRDYPLIITVDQNSVTEIHGSVPVETVITILKYLTEHFEKQLEG